jgi:hypothetical protein
VILPPEITRQTARSVRYLAVYLNGNLEVSPGKVRSITPSPGIDPDLAFGFG